MTFSRKKIIYRVFLPVTVILWFLIKVGDLTSKFFIPLWYISSQLSKLLVSSRQKKSSRSSKKSFSLKYNPPFKIPNLLLPHFKLTRKSKRGRPKSKPAIFYFFKKIKSFLAKIFPAPFRIALTLSIMVVLFFVYSFYLIKVAHNLPTPDKILDNSSPITTVFYDRSGKLLYRLYEGKNRSLVKLDQLPTYLIQATIAMEDKNFYQHPGIDPLAIGRAIIVYFRVHTIQGASTITQQLIKNTMLTPEKSIQRKLKEMMLSFWAERIFSKKQILEMYFNEAPFGGPAWGIAAASQTYFAKEPKDLSLAEASFLAGLPASPTIYSPYGTSPDLGKVRQKEVLRRMVEEKFITKEQAEQAANQTLHINPPINPIKAPHFVMYTRSYLAQKYGEKVVSQGGLRITTTLDLDTQEMAENVVSDEINKLANLRVSNGSTMITDSRNGQILAMVGSKNYFDPKEGNFNVALSPRQPGSSIKPITYATAFKLGYSPGNILLDTPVSFTNQWEVYSPANYDNRFHGPVSIRTALASSYNVPAVKMLAVVGIPNMLQTAHDLGITTLQDQDRYGLSLTLGGGEVKLIDMMTVYCVFANLGIRHDLQPILKIETADGQILEDNTKDSTGRRVLPAAVAFLITDILSDTKARTPAFGTNSLLEIKDHPHVAVKTGTTDSKRDNWTFGFTPEYVVGVWVGNNDNTPMDPALASGITGASPIWNKIMTNLLKNKKDLAFSKPEDVIESTVDGQKDLGLSNLGTKSVVGFGKKMIKDETSGSEKETITYTDPFSTYTAPPPEKKTDQPTQ